MPHLYSGRRGTLSGTSGSTFMSIKEMLNSTFQPATVEDWIKTGEASLKGKTIESLSRNTYENIKLKPLYTREDQDLESVTQYPGQADFRRGNAALSYVSDEWRVAQTLIVDSVDELKEQLQSTIQKGQSAISFQVNKGILQNISYAIENLHGKFPYALNAKNHQSTIIKELENLSNAEEGSGYIGKDPVALFVQGNLSFEGMEEEYNDWAKFLIDTEKNLPNLKTILIDTTPYHNGGANAVQELAVAISTGVYHLEQLLKRGLSLDKILSKLVFQFSIGANFFMEMAKLRTARILWTKVTEAYGAEMDNRGMVISARTSQFTKTVYDPYVNMLRAGNEAFAAVLGGVQYLHVSPYNEPEGMSTTFSERIARNTQLILKEETHVSKIVDPAGGSWYVESLTNELAEKAWELFLEMEDNEGIVTVCNTGWLQERIKVIKDQREKDIFTRKQSIVGTNVYANLLDQPLKVTISEDNQDSINLDKTIPQSRLSKPFELLRNRVEKMREDHIETAVGLVCLGKLKDHKPRADFISGFLAPGGLRTEWSQGIETSEQALAFIKETNLQQYFICGSDDHYKEFGLALCKEIKDKNPHIHLYLAGLPTDTEQQQWLEIGIKQFIHMRSNCYETLSALLTGLEGKVNE